MREHELVLWSFENLGYDIKEHGGKIHVHNNKQQLIAILELVLPDPFEGISLK